jgi:rSAM/selenodomain-associated transferase 2
MQAEPMRLSIVVPTLNEAGTLPALLADLDRLRAPGDEIVVVDGGSSDATPALAAGLADRVLSTAPGRASQMNAGAAVARGDTLWFVHADSRVPADARDAIAAALDAGAEWGRFDVRLSGTRPLLRLVEALMNLRSRASGIATGDQGIFVRRTAFEAVGGFPPIALMEDIALSRTLKRLCRPHCGVRPRLLTSSRRWEQRGIWRTILLMWRLRLAYALGADPGRLARRYNA